jgi:phosphate starvation-inducible PhoH-like protein
LNDLLPRGQLKRYIEDEIIEILPLAYMRGRTLDHAVIILDEAQNSTIGQMKMFLTRLGERSKMIVTGDVTQIDLPAYKTSGLIHASRILHGIPGMSFIQFNKSDIVRHPVVQDIIKAYSVDEEGTGPGGDEGEPEEEPKRLRARDSRFRSR